MIYLTCMSNPAAELGERDFQPFARSLTVCFGGEEREKLS